MAVDGYLNFSTKINTKGFEKGLGSIDKSLATLKRGLYDLAAAAGVAFSVKAIIDFGREAVNLASDMQEVQNVVDTAFGDMAYKMEEFADSSIKMYGISKLAAKQTGSTFAAMASGMGIAQDSATDMAVALTGLSADMASFYNVEQDVASTALKSVFTGETETLKQFGIVMTQTNLEAYALSQGITKSYQSMTEAEKVALRYGYVMQSTALAQGDFAKTSDGWANQMRILSEQWKEFSSVIGNVIMNVALPSIRALNDAMGTLISYTNAFAEQMGFETVQTAAAGITTEITGSVSGQEALTDAVNETAKSQENALAGFDKINKLSSGSSDSGGAASVSSASSPVASAAAGTAQQTASAIGSAFREVFKPLQDAWNDYGEPLMDSIRYAFGGIVSVISGIGQSFADVWSNGTAYTAASSILQIFTNISDTIGTISGKFATAWNSGTGTSIVQGIADNFQNVLDTINDCSAATADWAQDVDFEPLLKSVDGVVQALDPFTENVGEGLEWFYTNVLLPVADWTIEDAIPEFLESLEEALEGANSVWDTAAPVLKEELWDEFLKPLADWTADTAVTVIDKLGDGLKALGESISENDVRVLVGVAEAIGGIFLAVKGYSLVSGLVGKLGGWISGIGKALPGLLSTLGSAATLSLSTIFAGIGAAIAGWQIGSLLYDLFEKQINGVLWPFFDGCVAVFTAIGDFVTETIPEAFTAAWDGICDAFSGAGEWFGDRWDDITGAFSAAGTWFKEKFQTACTNVHDAFSGVGTWFSNRWADVKNAFSSVGTWFGEKFEDAYEDITGAFAQVGDFFGGIWDSIVSTFGSVADWFGEKFSAAWQAVKDVFSTGGEIFGDILDGLGDIFKDVVNAIIDGLNTVISAPFDAINDALGTVRDFSIMGSKPFSGLPTISIPEIPKLATGTVVPANYGEFLAVLGDNRREAEVVSPISTMEKAMENVLRRRGDGGTINLTINMDGKKVYQTVIRRNNESIRMTGKNPLNPKEATT